MTTSPASAAATRRRPVRAVPVFPVSATLAIPRYVYALSGALAVMAALSGVMTYTFGGVLTGPPVMNGSARGTALILFTVAVPVLAVAIVLAARGSVRAVFVWFGTTLYIAYNAFLMVLGTPLNRFFLLYVATLALATAAAIAVAVTGDARRLARRCAPTMPVRAIAIYLWVIVAFNVLAWLGRIVPATITDDAASLLDGTGLSMIPTYLQDLSFWLPLLAIGAAWLWRRMPWGYLIVGGGLVMWSIEGLTVATDQWFGHRADPASSVASDAVVVPFLVATVIGVFVAWVFLRHVERRGSTRGGTIDLRS